MLHLLLGCTGFALLQAGILYRESGVVTGITNRRWTALFPHSIAKSKEFMVQNKHTSTIWALAAGHYDRLQLVGTI